MFTYLLIVGCEKTACKNNPQNALHLHTPHRIPPYHPPPQKKLVKGGGGIVACVHAARIGGQVFVVDPVRRHCKKGTAFTAKKRFIQN